jgi:3-oxoacyl-[acyl-carrier-protein] synthase-1
MKDVFVVSNNILSPIGLTAAGNFELLKQSCSGIKKQENALLSEHPFYASLFKDGEVFIKEPATQTFTKFEKLLIASISDALQKGDINATDKKTLFIISSTKGNISLLETATFSNDLKDRIALQTSAKLVAEYFGFANKPIVISNACISGLLAIITGMRLIQSGQYQQAVIAGADVVSKFILSGFQSFQAISNEPCKPFDAGRNGINLGEGAGTIILSSDKKKAKGITISGGSVSNDANHISGPSRTGEELAFAIIKAMKNADVAATAIDFISAHGTATLYNDEMEANAITLAGLQQVPVNSLKGYFGHTLGAAGIIESIVSVYSLQQNTVLPTLGFKNMGVTKPINVCSTLHTAPLKHCLKTASGFGGCNAAIVISKK